MAMATFVLFFNNPKLFTHTGTKIRRGLAVKLIYACTTFEGVKKIFYEYALQLAKKNKDRVGTNVQDTSFVEMSVACANVM
jgi:farnesyl-diphosphate farnesyltransferase